MTRSDCEEGVFHRAPHHSNEPSTVVWLNTLLLMHGSDVMPHMSCTSPHNHSCSMFDFSLSLYCSWCLYSVTSRRWTNDHQFSQSLEQAGQCSSHPPQNMSQSFYLSKVGLVQCPLSFFFVCILYFVIWFKAVSQMSADTLSAPWRVPDPS